MIAILPHLRARAEGRDRGRHACGAGRVLGEGGGNGWPLQQALVPAREGASGRRPHAVQHGAMEQRRDRRVSPSERGATKPVRGAQPPGEPVLKHGGLPRRRRAQRVGERTRRAAERCHLAEPPGHRLILGVANILSHPRGGPGLWGARQQRRVRPALLNIFQDDGGIEDARLAVDEQRHLGAWVVDAERSVRASGAQTLGQLDVEGNGLLPQRDLDFLRVGRAWGFIEQHGG